ncbi:MAG TPA: DUF3016 domain-containing protein [Azonexus sp.]|nr:DUF3016 domain-containing protein [Azonexus sp.]
MKTRSLALQLGLLAVLAPSLPALADVSVEFVEPGRYTDAGLYGADSQRNLRALERHFKEQGERCLQHGESLELRVFDVDLAGRDEWWHRGSYDLRVMRDITWPRLDLAYVWRDASGKVLGEGREQVSDMSYLWRSAFVRNDTDYLPYEKAMLRDWFGQRFCREKASR